MQEVNVQVAVRVRPLLPKEEHGGERVCVRVIPGSNQLVLGKDKAFTFDHVLPSKLTQRQVYECCVESLVRSCFEGYNATIFAYGQTGSGKTYTMGGGYLVNVTDEDVGIIPRAIQHVFDQIATNNSRTYTVRVSYIEIYMDQLYDLLDVDNMSKDLIIREDQNGNTVIVGLTEIECETADDVMSHLERGSTLRRTGLTQMNEHSSRSHSIFTLLIEQRWTRTDGSETRVGSAGSRRSRKKSDASEDTLDDRLEIEHYMCAKFHFVDLAGSERANRTGNVGERLKESVFINGGLLALGNVISALADSKKKSNVNLHISFRDSKITRLLKDSLGGNAKTLMICCISPSETSFDESLNSLKYANRARNIKNKPVINRDPQSLRVEEMQSEIKALREELHRQRTAVMSAPPREIMSAQFDPDHQKKVEEKLSQLQTECSHYSMVTDEAYRLLLDMRDRNTLSNSHAAQLCDWLELVDEMKNCVPATLNRDVWDNRTINRLQVELEECKNDLKCDEEIFAEKNRALDEMHSNAIRLEQENAELRKKLELSEDSIHRLEEQLLAKQIELDKANAQLNALAVMEQKPINISNSAAGTSVDFMVDTATAHSTNRPSTRPRPVSVPAHFMVTERSMQNKMEGARDIHSSPAVLTVGRVVNNFRARSALIVSRLEDTDDVLQKTFDDSDTDDDPDGFASQVNKEFEFLRSDQKRGTYRVKPSGHLNRPTVEPNRIKKAANNLSMQEETIQDLSSTGEWAVRRTQVLNVDASEESGDMSRLHASTEMHSRQLRQTELDVRKSMQKMKDLNINIRLKEQLIRELVKTGQEAEKINAENGERIRALEEEKALANSDLIRLQKTLEELMARENTDKQQKDQLLIQYRKKMDAAKAHIQTLKKKQKEVEKMGEIANVASNNNKRAQELELAVTNMRIQLEQQQKHAREIAEQKARLEREVQKEKQKIRELEASNEQNRRVYKVKMDEMSVLHRRLRNLGLPVTATQLTDEQVRLEEQRKWLDQEMELVLQQRKAVEELEKELQQREEIIRKREVMLAEKNELEMKKLRSSQTVARDIVRVSTRLESVERLMEEKSRDMPLTSSHGQMTMREEMEALRQAREKLKAECGMLQTKAEVLSIAEERRLVELEEEVEALDAAIEFKTDSIAARQQDMRSSVSVVRSNTTLLTISNVPDTSARLSKLRLLSASEMRSLVSRYFDRIVDLRDVQRKMQNQISELEMKADEQMVRIAELESCLERSAMDTDRRLTQQQQDSERRIQLLMKQISEADLTGHSGLTAQLNVKNARITELEKDLFYYKSTSRELKKKLRQTTKDKGGSGEPGLTPNGTDGCEYIDTPREERVMPSKSVGRADAATHSDKSRADSAADSTSRSSRPSSAVILPADSQHQLKPVRSNTTNRDPSASASEKSQASVAAIKSTTPRDVLNSAAARGDLFPRQPSSGDSVSNSKRSMSHSSSGQNIAKPGFHSADAAGGGHGGASHDSGEAVYSDDRASRQDLAARHSSATAALSDKRTFRVLDVDEDGVDRLAAPVISQRSQRRNSKDLVSRQSAGRMSQEQKETLHLVDSLDTS